MSSSFGRELDIASKAVQLCADLTKQLQRRLKDESTVQKSDFSPVTIGDFAVQALLTGVIHHEFPNDTFLAEESADELRQNEPLLDQVWQLVETHRQSFSSADPPLTTPESKAELMDLIDMGGRNDKTSEGRTWVFDPIDGTATFMKGQQYAINCAFLVDGKEQIGIIGCPNLAPDATTTHEDATDPDGLGIMIYALRGNGTWKRTMQQSSSLLVPTRIHRHGDTASVETLIWSDCSTYTSTILPLHKQVVRKLNTSWPGVDLYSSLMKYAALGLGHSSICIRIFKFSSWRSNMWDHAGGVLIFEEAGGRVTDLEGREINFGKGRKMVSAVAFGSETFVGRLLIAIGGELWPCVRSLKCPFRGLENRAGGCEGSWTYTLEQRRLHGLLAQLINHFLFRRCITPSRIYHESSPSSTYSLFMASLTPSKLLLPLRTSSLKPWS